MPDQRSSAAPALMMCCLVGMCAVVALLFLIAEPPGGHGAPHDQFARTMYKGNIGIDRLADVRWLGLAFAGMQAIFFVSCLLLGTRKRGRLLVVVVSGGLLYVAAFVALVLADSVYAGGGAREIVLGLPVPTAIMIYVVTAVPVIFSVMYVLQFDQWILKPEDLERINQLAERRRQSKTEAD